jgi:serine/threonine-protein phosphatase 2A activator
VRAILDALGHVEQVAKEIPPVENSSSRFGNPAFRTFYDKVSEVPLIHCSPLILWCGSDRTSCIQLSPSLHASLPVLPQEAVAEVSVYFTEAWGNRSRIDYGSGMELNFLCWLYVHPYFTFCNMTH